MSPLIIQIVVPNVVVVHHTKNNLLYVIRVFGILLYMVILFLLFNMNFWYFGYVHLDRDKGAAMGVHI